jgi:hypothetical protein
LGHRTWAKILNMGKAKNAGQSLTELAICIMAISAAFISMQIYVQRSMQARYKDGADYCLNSIQKQDSKLRKQYDPYYAESAYSETNSSNVTKGFPDRSTEQTTIRDGQKVTGTVANAD